MKGLEGRLSKLEAKGGSDRPPFLVLLEDADGTRRDPRTREPVVPPPGAFVVVLGVRPDGPQ